MPLTQPDISRLVRVFYGRVRLDPFLSPVFVGKIGDSDAKWAEHIAHVETFWCSIFLKTRSFDGNPMQKHIGIAEIAPQHFTRWLAMFQDAADATLSQPQSDEIMVVANRIARSFQMGLAFHHDNNLSPPNPFAQFSPILRHKNKV